MIKEMNNCLAFETKKLSVSIIISVFEQLDYSKRCFSCLVDTLEGIIDYEIIVIDDGSGDKTKDYLKSLEYPFKVLFNTKRGALLKIITMELRKQKENFFVS